jgi:hypothetical protein
VITGPSGSGKTSLLRAIAAAKEDLAPWGARPSWSSMVRHRAGAAKLRTAWELGDEERTRLGVEGRTLEGESIFGPDTVPGRGHDARLQMLLERYDHDPDHGKMEYFPAERTLAPEALGLTILETALQRRMRMEADVRKYGILHRYLYELHLGLHDRFGKPPGRERFAELFTTLCPERRVLGLVRTSEGMELLFEGGPAGAAPIPKLPHAAQQAVLFAGTFEMLGLNESVVLVDTPELHQGHAEAGAFALKIASLGANNQIFFATGSSEVLAALEDATVVTLEP